MASLGQWAAWLVDLARLSVTRQTIAMSAALLLAYIVLALTVSARRLAAFDVTMMIAVQSQTNLALDYLLTALTPLVSAEFSVVWLALAIWLLWRAGFAYRSLAALWIGAIVPLEFLSKAVVVQPPVGEEFTRLLYDFPLLVVRTAYTYPSGHAARTTFLCLLICWALWRFSRPNWQRVVGLFSVAAVGLLMAFSRFYFGHHWPTDVLGGMLLGAAFAGPAITALDRARSAS